MKGFAVVDCETTGLNTHADRIIECAIITLDEQGNEEGVWSSLINPRVPVKASFVHGLYDSDVAAAPFFEEVARNVASLLEGRAFVAHNAAFDAGFLEASLHRAGLEYSIPPHRQVCTMELSKIYLPDGKHNLRAVAQRAGISLGQSHRALADAHVAAELLRFYMRAEAHGKRYADYARTRTGRRIHPASWLDALVQSERD